MAQSVEHCTGIAEVMGLNPVGTSKFFLHFFSGLIESFHLSGHTFRFHWTVQDLEVFLVQSKSPLAVEGLL